MKYTVWYKHTFIGDTFWFCFSKKQAKKCAVKLLKKEMPDIIFPVNGVSHDTPFVANGYEDLIEEIEKNF